MSTLFGKERSQYTGQVKKYTSLFGSLFSDLYITRKSGDLRKDHVRVPIRFGHGQIRNKSDLPNDNLRTGLVLPAMAFELQSLAKDTTRMVNQNNRIRSGVPEIGNFNEKFSKSPVPYNITYRMGIRTNSIEDMLMILEQIISVFNPQVSIHVIDNNDMAIERDITVVLTSDVYDFIDNYEHSMEETRIIQVDLDFVVKGYMYKFEEIKPVLLSVKVDPDVGDYGFTEAKNTTEGYVQQAATDNIGNLLSGATQGG